MGFNGTKFKVQLKLSMNRLNLLRQKKNSINQNQRKEISKLIQEGKIESARIRVEHIIREDYMIEAMEVLEMFCDLLLARFGLFEMKYCDQAIQEAVHTLIYSASRSEVKELLQIRDQLISKFGSEFGEAALNNRLNLVNPRVIQRLKVQAPDPMLVYSYLKEIANSYKVPFTEEPPTDPQDNNGPSNPSTGGLGVLAAAPPVVNVPQSIPAKTPVLVNPISVKSELPSYQSSNNIQPDPLMLPKLPGEENYHGYLTKDAKASSDQKTDEIEFPEIPKTSQDPSAPEESEPDFDELAKRFEILKKKK